MRASILPFALSLSKPVLSGVEGDVVRGATCFDWLSTSGVLIGGAK